MIFIALHTSRTAIVLHSKNRSFCSIRTQTLLMVRPKSVSFKGRLIYLEDWTLSQKNMPVTALRSRSSRHHTAHFAAGKWQIPPRLPRYIRSCPAMLGPPPLPGSSIVHQFTQNKHKQTVIVYRNFFMLMDSKTRTKQQCLQCRKTLVKLFMATILGFPSQKASWAELSPRPVRQILCWPGLKMMVPRLYWQIFWRGHVFDQVR